MLETSSDEPVFAEFALHGVQFITSSFYQNETTLKDQNAVTHALLQYETTTRHSLVIKYHSLTDIVDK